MREAARGRSGTIGTLGLRRREPRISARTPIATRAPLYARAAAWALRRAALYAQLPLQTPRAGMVLFAQLGQVWITRGLALEPAGRATALSYAQIAFAALWGALFFGELPGPATLAGAATIALGTWIGARAIRARAQ